MIDLDLRIKHDEFALVGSEIKFNSEKYLSLLGNLAVIGSEDSKVTLNVHLWKPFMARTPIGGIMRTFRRSARQNGEYLNGQNIINLFANPHDSEQSNKTLLHETKHLADDMSGVLPSTKSMGRSQFKRLLPYGATIIAAEIGAASVIQETAGNSAIGVCAGTGVAILGTAALVSTAFRVGYRASPWEVQARAFADDPVVMQEYGDIIEFTENERVFWHKKPTE
jgi:hypothetical protein